MIDFLHGELARKSPGAVTVCVGGVGFAVRIPASTYDALPPEGREVHLHTHLHVREDELALFGFATEIERELFTMLLGVSQVGPVVALNVLSACPPDQFKSYVLDDDAQAIAALVKGIGPKTARRLIVELQSRMKDLAVAPARTAGSQLTRDTVQALMALGESRAAAERAVHAALEKLGPDADQQSLMQEALSR